MRSFPPTGVGNVRWSFRVAFPARPAGSRRVSPVAEPWQRDVVYQVYPRSFSDSNGDGVGDLPGLTARLDHLSGLGVDVVWLSPIYASPQDDNGYDISDYLAIDPVFGTLADFEDLVAGLHDRGMKLMMDLVVNHTSDEHPWFMESRTGTDSPKRDWYWWRPARPGHTPGTPGAEPTNWGSAFSGPAWTLDPSSGEYYLHLFSPKQPDLNWENPEVRAAVHGIMRWWLERGVDGFRMDVINYISKDPALPDGPGTGPCVDGSAAYRQGPRLHEYLAEMHREVFAGRLGHILTVGEMPGVTVADARRTTDPAAGELDMVFGFDHVWLDHDGDKWHRRPSPLPELKAVLGRWQAGLAEVGWNSLYWSNHDQPRAVSRWGDVGGARVTSAKMLAIVLHLQRGTPYVYQGEEIGMTNAAFTTIDEFRDIEVLNHYTEAVGRGEDPAAVMAGILPLNRDNARTPMQWDDGANAGFTHGTPWIGINPNHRDINAAQAYADPDSIYHFYRRLIALRHDLAVVVDGDCTLLLPDHPDVYAFTRRLGPDALLVLGNFSDHEVTVEVGTGWERAEVLIANLPVITGRPPGALRPWEAVVYRVAPGPPASRPAPGRSGS
jgi:oligo-1,6-glucosidase